MTEIQNFVDGVVDGRLSDFEVEAWMRNVFENGLSEDDTVELTHAMLNDRRIVEGPSSTRRDSSHG